MDSPARPRIVALGDLIVDVVASASGPLVEGSDRAGRIAFRQGGSAANTARSAAEAGAEAVFIGSVGRDDWGRRLGAALEAAGVEVHLVPKAAPTARIVALVTPDGERSFVTDRGAADLLTAADLRAGWFARSAALHLPAYVLYHARLAPAADRAVSLARGSGAFVSVDLASSQPIVELGPTEAQARLGAIDPDLLFGNEAEVTAVLGGRPEAALLDLAPLVVVKQGGHGCRILRRTARGAHPAWQEVATRPVAAPDTTGAGDAFAAGFLTRWVSAAAGRREHPATLAGAARMGHRTAGRLLRDAGRRSYGAPHGRPSVARRRAPPARLTRRSTEARLD